MYDSMYFIDSEELVLTAWIQWTITKIAIKLYVTEKETLSSLKLVLELEDIITSLDLQPVYFKLKNKVTTATIFHYTRYIITQICNLCNFNVTNVLKDVF